MSPSKKVQLNYPGSKFWLIFWLIVFFPVAVVLILTAFSFKADATTYSIQYGGSRFWLCFWAVLCFPVAVILGLLNGFSVAIDNQPTPQP